MRNLLVAALIGGLALTFPLSAQQSKAWTVLVYMAADNDLEGSALEDLGEMMKVGSSANLNLVVQIDRAEGNDDSPVGNLPDFTGAKRLLVQKGSLKELKNLGETNTGDPRTLQDFVTWGLATYPAARTALVLWDHGGGVFGFGTDDSAEGKGLSLPELKTALQSGLRKAGRDRLDLVGFDACLMATLETARTVAPLGRWLLASEETEPGFGWDWTALGLLNSNPAASPVDLGRALLASYAAFCADNGEGAQYTLSLTDLDKIGPIEAALQALDGAAVPRLDQVGGAFGRARFQSVEFGKSGDPSGDYNLVDVGDLARRWQKVPALASGARALAQAVAAAVVAHQDGSVQKAATGLSLWFPPDQDTFDSAYADYGPPAWAHLLTSYYEAGAALPPEGRAGGSSPAGRALPRPDGPPVLRDGVLTLTRRFAPAVLENTAEALLTYGLSGTDGQVTVLGSREADIDPARGTVTGDWDLSALTLVQGSRHVRVFLREDQAEDPLMAFSVPFSYYPQGNPRQAKGREDLWLAVTVDLDKNEVVEETFFQETEEGVTAQFEPEPGSRIVAQVLRRGPRGDWEYRDSGVALDPNQTIDYEFRDIDPRSSLYLSIDISDFGGHDDSREFVGKVP